MTYWLLDSAAEDETNIIARMASADPADNGLAAVVVRDGTDYLLRYEPRDGDWATALYHECAVISVHATPEEATIALQNWAA